MRLWFLFFVVAIGVGGFFALMVALGRTPGVHTFLPQGIFYHWLVGHVDSALIIGLLSFLAFLWHRVFRHKESGAGFLLCALGFFLIALTSLFGLGTALYNNYVPTILHPMFFTGLLLFGLGYLITSLRFLSRSLRDLISSDPLRSVLSISVVLSVLMIASSLLSLALTPSGEPALYFERLYWIPGHIHQFVNACLLISVWTITARTAEFRVAEQLRYLNLLLLIFPLVFLLVQVLGKDPLSREVKALTTFGYAVGIGVPTLAWALYLLIKVSFRRGFYTHVLGLSVLLYLVGAGMGYLIAGSDLRIPAHYHGVMGSILIGVMGVTYHLLKEMGYRDDLPGFIKFQPFLYWLGMILFVISLFWAGLYGSPRKVFGTGYIESFEVYLFMVIMGAGSVLSVLGGGMFVLFVIYSILRPGKGVRYETEGKTQQAD